MNSSTSNPQTPPPKPPPPSLSLPHPKRHQDLSRLRLKSVLRRNLIVHSPPTPDLIPVLKPGRYLKTMFDPTSHLPLVEVIHSTRIPSRKLGMSRPRIVLLSLFPKQRPPLLLRSPSLHLSLRSSPPLSDTHRIFPLKHLLHLALFSPPLLRMIHSPLCPLKSLPLYWTTIMTPPSSLESMTISVSTLISRFPAKTHPKIILAPPVLPLPPVLAPPDRNCPNPTRAFYPPRSKIVSNVSLSPLPSPSFLSSTE